MLAKHHQYATSSNAKLMKRPAQPVEDALHEPRLKDIDIQRAVSAYQIHQEAARVVPLLEQVPIGQAHGFSSGHEPGDVCSYGCNRWHLLGTTCVGPELRHDQGEPCSHDCRTKVRMPRCRSLVALGSSGDYLG